jgi:hypothetical protein
MDLFEAAGVVAEKRPRTRTPDPYRDTEFGAEELEYFANAPVRELAAWHYDMLEADDDVGCRSRRTRQLAAIIKRRKISDQQLGEALRLHRRESVCSGFKG